MRIMERLDKLSLGIRGQNTDEDHLPFASPATDDHTASSLDALQALFNAPRQTLVHLGPAVRQEQDPSLSKSYSRDLPLGVPLRTMCLHLH